MNDENVIETSLVDAEPALLERWMREFYFDTDYDIGSSGVESFSIRDLRELGILTLDELDSIRFNDSPTLGCRALRESIAMLRAKGDVNRVIATHGSSEAIFLVAQCLVRRGDEIVVMDPCYQQLFATAEALGAVVKRWPLRFEDGYRPDLDRVAELIGPRTRLVVANFPHNPTGAVLSSDERLSLVAIAARVGAYVLWDGAFEELIYGNAPDDSPPDYDRYIRVGTLSKAYGFPGVRIGWCVTSPELVQRFMHLRDYTILHLSPLVELIGKRVLDNAATLVGVRRRQAKQNLEKLQRWMERHMDCIEWVVPQGGVSAFPRLRGVLDVEHFCRTLAREHRTLLVPGICFRSPQHVRLGFGGASGALERGLENFSALLRRVSVRRAS